MTALAWVTAALAVAFAVSPFISDPFIGFRADQLPIPQIRPPIQPAGYAFSIWGLIYLWLIVSTLYGAAKRSDDPTWHAARPWLAASLAIGVPWIAIANASVLWATLTIWLMLGTALMALAKTPQADRLLLRAPVALYAGWLSAASFVALAALLAGNGIGRDATGWALILIPCAVVLSAAVQVTQSKAPEYGFAVSWALAAIAIANASTITAVTVAASAGAAAITLLAVRSARRA